MYSGDTNYLPASGGNWFFSIFIPDFSISLESQSLIVNQGQTAGPDTVSVVPVDGLTGTVSFSCSGLPSGATCVFSPSTVTLPGATYLTITTTQGQDARVRVLSQNVPRNLGWLRRAGGIASAFLFVVLIPRRRRRSFGFLTAGMIAVAYGVASCGGGSGGGSSSPIYTTTSLYAATTTPAQGANDSFTADVSGGTGSQPTGTVQFSVDGAASGTPMALSNEGNAQFVTSFANPGLHSVSAAYSGDSTHGSSASSPLQVSVPYTVTITATSGTLSHTAALTLTLQ